MKYLIAGLGNPGPKYELTRHNVGFLVVDQIADKYGLGFSTQRLADKSEVKYRGRSIHLIKPNTFMNLSGRAVAYWMKELAIPVENTLVVVDDIALPFGALRMRARGSSAGHNGLKDIELALGTPNYPRLRFGIGNEFSKGGQVDFVLSNFLPEEFEAMDAPMKKAVDMVLAFCTIGIERTMSRFNS